MASERRNWLILSLKHSTGDWLVWYCTACAGYTSSIVRAGRYTEAEARADECTGHTVAVCLDWLTEGVAAHFVVPNDGRLMGRLKRQSAKTKRQAAAVVS